MERIFITPKAFYEGEVALEAFVLCPEPVAYLTC